MKRKPALGHSPQPAYSTVFSHDRGKRRRAIVRCSPELDRSQFLDESRESTHGWRES